MASCLCISIDTIKVYFVAGGLVTSLLIMCGFLVSVSAIQRYTSNFITQGATIMIFLGSISVMFPSGCLEFEQIYDFIVDGTPGLILLIIISQTLDF